MVEFHCIIVEDDAFDRQLTESLVLKIPGLRLSGSFSNVLEVSDRLQDGNIQIVFMDIDLPILSGLDFFRTLINPPLFIFITAHPEFALEGFELNAFDYIVKPLKFERLEKAVSRAKEFLEIQKKSQFYDIEFQKNLLTLKEGTSTIQILLNDILYLEAFGDYTRVITHNKKYMILQNLKSFVKKLPENKILRIHRSYAVAVEKINQIKDNELLLGNIKLPVGKTFRREVNRHFN